MMTYICAGIVGIVILAIVGNFIYMVIKIARNPE